MNKYALTFSLMSTLVAAPVFAEREGLGYGQVKSAVGVLVTPFGFAAPAQETPVLTVVDRDTIVETFDSASAGAPEKFEGVWSQVLVMRWDSPRGLYQSEPALITAVLKITGRNSAVGDLVESLPTPFGMGHTARIARSLTRAWPVGDGLGQHPSVDDRFYAPHWSADGAALTREMVQGESPSIPPGAVAGSIQARATCRLVQEESHMLCRMTITNRIPSGAVVTRVEYYGFERGK